MNTPSPIRTFSPAARRRPLLQVALMLGAVCGLAARAAAGEGDAVGAAWRHFDTAPSAGWKAEPDSASAPRIVAWRQDSVPLDGPQAEVDPQPPGFPPGLEEARPSTAAPSTLAFPLKSLRPIGEIGISIAPPVAPEDLPEDVAAAYLNPRELTVLYGPAPFHRSLSLFPLPCTADYCHRPLYFEEINLERYGTTLGVLQPAVSAARFFGRLPQLPYRMSLHRSRICYYHRHPYEAGRAAPWEREAPPLRIGPGLIEAGFATGLMFIFP